MPKVLRLPDNIMQQIQMYCESERIALAMMGSESMGVHILLLGDQEAENGIDRACVIAASILLNGVISGQWHQGNEELREHMDKPIPKENLN